MTLGPFDITPERIQALGPSFTPFVNRLLVVEVSGARVHGYQLAINSNENTPDGGVDAALRNGVATDFIPAGDSAWQFKRTSLGPQACAEEFGGAAWAHEFVRTGGAYIMVMGVALPDNLIEARRRSVAEKALELGLLAADDPDRLRVYDANRLARWASRFPALAVSQLSGGPGLVAGDFDTWATGFTHTTTWVPDDGRSAAAESIRSQVTSQGVVEVRIQGESGIGKTRLVMEALRMPDLRPLVAYVADANAVSGELLAHLVSEGRTAVLVVDECPAERHIKLVEQLPSDPAIKLVTIGDLGPALSRGPVIGIVPIASEVTDEFLKVNFATLSPEARRFVADHSRGNPRWMIALAGRVAGASDAQAADLIARNDIEQFIATLLPEGRGFFCAAVLALLDRVGWDGELRYQVERLASFAGATVEEMEAVASDLAQRGLLNRTGRYRMVSPHPLAVYLAAEGWRGLGKRLVEELLPQLDEGMALAFFRRVADLGRFEPARSVLPRLLASDGPFSSLAKLEGAGLGRVLTQLAIVMPDEVALHLRELFEEVDRDTLVGQHNSRRDLVWTLEKLAWHSTTFETAADSLLRLALAENETYANNATGTWVELFGTFLPGTAASPSDRVAYLRRVASSTDPEIRALVVKAAAGSLTHNESVTVSGELQGGVLVESRGTPATYGDAGHYRREMIGLLVTLTSDPDRDVATAAADVLIGAIHPMIDDAFAGEALIDAVVALGDESLRRVRAEAERLMSLYDRHEQEDRRVREQLAALLDRLPPPSPAEQVRVLGQLRRWDIGEGELQRRMLEAIGAVGELDRRVLADEVLAAELPAAWELGHALAQLDDEEAFVPSLVGVFPTNPDALLGYLIGRQDAGSPTAFDDFLDGDLGRRLSLRDQVALAVRGLVTDRARQRIIAGIRTLPVADAISAIFGWHRNLTEDDLVSVLEDWTSRIESQRDYNAVVDWLSLVLHPKGAVPPKLQDHVWRLLAGRADYPELGQEGWDWSRLAGSFATARPLELGRLIVELIDSHDVMIHESHQEAALLGKAAATAPKLWDDIAERLLGGSWRLQMQLRGWFLHHMQPPVIEGWIGDDIERARIVASLAPIGGAEPSPFTRFLLDRFGTDDEVRSSLYGALVTGFWTGNESDRIARQVAQLTAWRTSPSEPLGVRRWAKEIIDHLEEAKEQALQREAEEHW